MWDWPSKAGLNIFLLKWREKEVKSLSRVRLFATPWTTCSLPCSSVHGTFQAIVLEWVAISLSSGSSRPRDWTRVSRIVDRRLTVWATREVQLLNNDWYYYHVWDCQQKPYKFPCQSVHICYILSLVNFSLSIATQPLPLSPLVFTKHYFIRGLPCNMHFI